MRGLMQRICGCAAQRDRFGEAVVAMTAVPSDTPGNTSLVEVFGYAFTFEAHMHTLRLDRLRGTCTAHV